MVKSFGLVMTVYLYHTSQHSPSLTKFFDCRSLWNLQKRLQPSHSQHQIIYSLTVKLFEFSKRTQIIASTDTRSYSKSKAVCLAVDLPGIFGGTNIVITMDEF